MARNFETYASVGSISEAAERCPSAFNNVQQYSRSGFETYSLSPSYTWALNM